MTKEEQKAKAVELIKYYYNKKKQQFKNDNINNYRGSDIPFRGLSDNKNGSRL